MRSEGSAYSKYMNKTFAPEDASLSKIRKALSADGKEGINISSAEGRLLQFLIGLGDYAKVVEVGTLYAYSTLWMARALPENGKIFSLELDPGNYQKALGLLEGAEGRDRIDLRNGSGLALLEELSAEGPFDMIFIDANKGGYEEYLDWAEVHIRKGGLIIGDNTFLFGHLVGEPRNSEFGPEQVKVMENFNQRLSDPSRYLSVMIPTFEGMTVAKKLF